MSSSSDSVTWGARTDVGRVRSVNQDSVHAEPSLFVVADGMGGHRGGEVASAVAVDAMSSADDAGVTDSVEALVERVRLANGAIIEKASGDGDLAGMGTTVCALAILEPDWKGGVRIGLVNVGDSRIYRFADGSLEQVSRDHSLVADLVEQGHLTEAEAEEHPQRNIVTRALGIADHVDVDSWELVARSGEYYLLCSDGLVNEVGDAQIAATMRRLDDPAEVADDLVRQANENGARDNVTVVVVRVDAGATGPPDPLPVGPREAAVSTGASLLDDREPNAPDPERDRVPGARGVSVAPPPEAPPGVSSSDRSGRADRRRGGIGLRAAVATGLIVVIIAASLVVIGLYARNNYFVGFDEAQVVIYQGRPGGVLWFDPTIEQPTEFLRDDLTGALELEIDAQPEFGTLAEAQDYVADLEERLSDVPDSGSG